MKRTSELLKNNPEIARFLEYLLADDTQSISKLLNDHPDFAERQFGSGATRVNSVDYFVDDLMHYIYSDDTALHIAAIAYSKDAIKLLVRTGGDVHARNRRGAQPLHYASDGGPNSPTWNPKKQEAAITKLIELGADPNALDKSGVAPLHRAVRQRCTGAVRALIAGKANVNLKNKSGNTPLKLARLTTGRGGSGTDEAKREQEKIIELLIAADAK